jgi:hypothetical protein
MSAPEWLRNKQGGAFGADIDQTHHRIMNAFKRWTQDQSNSSVYRWWLPGKRCNGVNAAERAIGGGFARSMCLFFGTAFCEFDPHQIKLRRCG